MRIVILLLASLITTSCISFKEQAVIQDFNGPVEAHIANVYSLQISEGRLNSEVWSSGEGCVDVKEIGEESALHLKWDKIAGGCDWVGIGIGWDGWAVKNISSAINLAAIELKLKMVEGPSNNLPVAFALEDYSGGQAWLGFSSNALEKGNKMIGTDWTYVRLPLSEFDWSEGGDPYNVKQMMIQLEASGNVLIDEIKLVPYKGSYKQRAFASINHNWNGAGLEALPMINRTASVEFNDNKFLITSTASDLHITGFVKDGSPLINNHSGNDVWNGDAVEIAISTNPSSQKKRKRYISTDHHLGIRMSAKDPFVWSWKEKRYLEMATVTTRKVINGYQFSCKIPHTELGFDGFKSGNVYGFQLAVDHGDASGERNEQQSWNNPQQPDFNMDPSLWGEILFED